jgi:hypothetical protein
MFLNTRKKQMTPPPLAPLSRIRSFHPFAVLTDPRWSWFYDTPICSLGGDAPFSPPISDTHAVCSYPFVDVGFCALLSQNG